jgi:hypothetical protein
MLTNKQVNIVRAQVRCNDPIIHIPLEYHNILSNFYHYPEIPNYLSLVQKEGLKAIQKAEPRKIAVDINNLRIGKIFNHLVTMEILEVFFSNGNITIYSPRIPRETFKTDENKFLTKDNIYNEKTPTWTIF